MRLGTATPTFRLGTVTPSRIYLGLNQVWPTGGSPLLDGLVDWWDSGLTNGQHSGIAFTNSNYSLGADPFGGDLAYYANSVQLFRPGLPTSISALDPWTAACVFYKVAGIQLYALASTSGTNPSVIVQGDGSVISSNWFDFGALGTLAGAGTVSTGWHSFVTSYADGVVNFYLDGALLATRSVSHTTANFQPAFAYFFRLGVDARCAVGAIATRAWSLGDAISFHDSGSFKRYQDFSGFEPETNVYFARIVAAGSSISSANQAAVNAFVVGCKADGIWSAIKASCILAGADTLAGALVPLVGVAPTTGLTSYNRLLGLSGTGVADINPNILATVDPTNNAHVAVWSTLRGSGDFCFNSGSLRKQITADASGITSVRLQSTTAISSPGASGLGFVGTARNSGINLNLRADSVTTNFAANSSNLGGAMLILRGTHRISFYSIGENLDLALLDARLTTLMSSLT